MIRPFNKSSKNGGSMCLSRSKVAFEQRTYTIPSAIRHLAMVLFSRSKGSLREIRYHTEYWGTDGKFTTNLNLRLYYSEATCKLLKSSSSPSDSSKGGVSSPSASKVSRRDCRIDSITSSSVSTSSRASSNCKFHHYH